MHMLHDFVLDLCASSHLLLQSWKLKMMGCNAKAALDAEQLQSLNTVSVMATCCC
jgi:hypothetical protein